MVQVKYFCTSSISWLTGVDPQVLSTATDEVIKRGWEVCIITALTDLCVFAFIPLLIARKILSFWGYMIQLMRFWISIGILAGPHRSVCVCADLCPTEIFKQHFFCVTPVHTKGFFYLMYWPGLILGEAHKARNNHLVPNLVTSGVGRRRWQSSLLPTFVNRTCRSWPCWVTAWPPPHPVPELTSLWLLPSPWQQDRCFDSTPCETTPLVSVQLWWRLCVVHICLQNYHRTEKGRESLLRKDHMTQPEVGLSLIVLSWFPNQNLTLTRSCTKWLSFFITSEMNTSFIAADYKTTFVHF